MLLSNLREVYEIYNSERFAQLKFSTIKLYLIAHYMPYQFKTLTMKAVISVAGSERGGHWQLNRNHGGCCRFSQANYSIHSRKGSQIWN